MGCTLSFCHFTNSESEAPRSWVARQGLLHSCGWPMSTRTPRPPKQWAEARSSPKTAPAAPDSPPAPSWSPLPLPLHFALRRDPLLFSRHARLCPGADSCAFAWTAAFSYFPRTPSTPCPRCQHCAHADLSPSGRTQAALPRQARCRLISPLPRTAAIAHGRPRTCDHAVATCLASHALLRTWGPVPTPPPRELLLPKKPVTAIG